MAGEKKTEVELKRNVEEKYMMLQLISGQMQEIQKEIGAMEEKANDVASLKNNLKSLAESKAGSKSFSSLGLGTYVESEIKNTENVLVNVGAGVFVKKTAKEAEEIIEKQISQLDSINMQLTQNLTMLATRAQELEGELQALAGTLQ